jgi:hypothetical protein
MENNIPQSTHEGKPDQVTTLPLIQVNQIVSADLESMEVVELDLVPEYWTPQQPGESRRLIFLSVSDREDIDESTGEIKVLPTALFYIKDESGWKLLMNSSIRLVASIRNNKIPAKTPLLITYKGKRRNTTNQFSSDDWSIHPLKRADVKG